MSITKQLLLLLLVTWSSQDQNVNPVAESDDPITRVVGGKRAPDGAVPYLVALSKRNHRFVFCGSSLLSDRWILTAAHCIREKKAADIVAIVGTNSRSKGGTKYELEKLIMHPKHTKRPQSNDVGLIKTIKKIEFSEKVKPISLPTKDTKEGTTALLAGWGFIDQEGKTFNDNLQWLNVTIRDINRCKVIGDQNFPVTDNHLCTYNKVGQGTCMGDSGSGLNQKNEVVGIVSWNRPCARGYPDIFARVYNYKGWIEKTMKES